MTNILNAILNFASSNNTNIKECYIGKNKMNNMGDAAEYYIKDLFADSIDDNMVDKEKKYEQCFSYHGNSSNPPDFVIKSGDAVEVKKIQGKKSDIALNSSYPKSKLMASDSRITQTCKDCEEWDEKDIIYAIVSVPANAIESLWMVYGDCYCADSDIYQRICTKMSDGIKEIPDIELAEDTNELARLNKVDPMGLTYLRVRGMWGIKHPCNVFHINDTEQNILNVIMLAQKYNSFPQADIKAIEANQEIHIRDIDIKDPNNAEHMLKAKHIFIKKK